MTSSGDPCPYCGKRVVNVDAHLRQSLRILTPIRDGWATKQAHVGTSKVSPPDPEVESVDRLSRNRSFVSLAL